MGFFQPFITFKGPNWNLPQKWLLNLKKDVKKVYSYDPFPTAPVVHSLHITESGYC